MTREQKKTKLGNALKQYRGRINPGTGKWIRPPDPSARRRVERWLTELGLSGAALAKIDGFKTFGEYRDWIKTI